MTLSTWSQPFVMGHMKTHLHDKRPADGYCSTLGKSHQRNNDIKKEYVLYLQYLMIQVYNVLFGYGTRIAWSADIVDSLLSQCCDV